MFLVQKNPPWLLQIKLLLYSSLGQNMMLTALEFHCQPYEKIIMIFWHPIKLQVEYRVDLCDYSKHGLLRIV